MFTLHPKTLQTLPHLEMDGSAGCIDGSPTRTSIYHALPQAPRLYIHAVCDLFLYIVAIRILKLSLLLDKTRFFIPWGFWTDHFLKTVNAGDWHFNTIEGKAD